MPLIVLLGRKVERCLVSRSAVLPYISSARRIRTDIEFVGGGLVNTINSSGYDKTGRFLGVFETIASIHGIIGWSCLVVNEAFHDPCKIPSGVLPQSTLKYRAVDKTSVSNRIICRKFCSSLFSTSSRPQMANDTGCYFPDGVTNGGEIKPHFVPCDPSASVSACCAIHDPCLSSGLCRFHLEVTRVCERLYTCTTSIRYATIDHRGVQFRTDKRA